MLSAWAIILILLAAVAAVFWGLSTAWGDVGLLQRLGVRNAGEERLPAVRADPPTSELLANIGRV